MVNTQVNREPSGTVHRWSVLRATFITYFYDSYDLAILAVVMPALLPLLDIDLSQGGLLASSTMIGAAVGSIIFGLIAENYGRRIAIVISLVEFGIGTLFVYYVETWGGWMVLRFVTGLGIGGVWGPCVALLAMHWAPRYTARANAFMLSTFALGWIVASIIGRLVFAYDWRYLFLLGGTSALVAIYVWFAVPDDRVPQSEKRDQDSAKTEKIALSVIFNKENRRQTILATVLNVCQMGGFWGAATWIPTFLVKERGLAMPDMASFVALLYIGMFVGYQLFGYCGDKIGRRNTILLCFVIDCVTVPLYLLVSNPTFLFWFGPVIGLAFGGVFGVMGSFYAELFPQRIRALAGGFCFNVGRLGAVIAPFTVGYIGKTYGLAAGIASSPVLFVLGILVCLALPETLPKKKGIPSAA